MQMKVVQYCLTQATSQRSLGMQLRGRIELLGWEAGRESLDQFQVAPCWAHRVQKQSPTPFYISLFLMSPPVFIPSISQGHPYQRDPSQQSCVCLREQCPIHFSTPSHWESHRLAEQQQRFIKSLDLDGFSNHKGCKSSQYVSALETSCAAAELCN